MAHAPYQWKDKGDAAPIEQHSIAKHEVLSTYLREYLQTLVTSPYQEELRVTLVDGFAGGGAYQDPATHTRVLGSPFVFLRTAKEAEALINLGRQKPIRMAVDYIFVEKDDAVFDLLSRSLKEEGFGPRVGQDIQLLNSAFEREAQLIQDFVAKKSPRVGRSLFLLDQYGYKDVPLTLIRQILSRLPGSEVILTFNVDSFINFASDSDATRRSLEQIGIPDVLRGRTIEDIKSTERDFRLYIQSCMYQAIVNATGAEYYTVFFIRTNGHGDYWLMHLSQHHRARDVMTRVHWAQNNQFVHYGGAGLDMFQALGYHAKYDSAHRGQSVLEFGFDDVATRHSVEALSEQLPRYIFARDEGIGFGELFSRTCNGSPADSERYKQALQTLMDVKDVEVVSINGARRLKASTIRDSDVLLPSRQFTMFTAAAMSPTHVQEETR